jgi:hypothetical protein
VAALRQLQLVTFFDAQPAAAISDVDTAAQPCVPISAVEPWLTHFTAIKGSTEDQDARRAVAAALAELKNEGYRPHLRMRPKPLTTVATAALPSTVMTKKRLCSSACCPNTSTCNSHRPPQQHSSHHFK